jgi:hypothetical protein
LRATGYANLVRGLNHPISGRRIHQAIGLSMQSYAAGLGILHVMIRHGFLGASVLQD